jgi:hypothetical protein
MGEYFTCKVCGVTRMHRAGLVCTPCTVEQLRSRIEELESQLTDAREALGEIAEWELDTGSSPTDGWFMKGIATQALSDISCNENTPTKGISVPKSVTSSEPNDTPEVT